MLRASHHRIHGPGDPIRVTVESALWNAGALLATLVAIAILFFGILANRAL